MPNVKQRDLRRAERRDAIISLVWIIALALIAAGTVYAVLHIELITLAKGH